MKIAGFCPMGCGETLFVGEGGHVTCSYVKCPEPTALARIIEDRETGHVVVFTEKGFDAQHPLRERVDGELFDCPVHRALSALDGPPVAPGRYRVRLAGRGSLLYDRLGSSS